MARIPPPSPIGARRVKTDLQTSENVFGRSRSNSPLLPRHQLPRSCANGSGTASPRIIVTSFCGSAGSSAGGTRIRSYSSGASIAATTGRSPISQSPSRGAMSNGGGGGGPASAVRSQLPARATRLLTRRLQNNATPTNCGTGGSESPRSIDSLPRRSALSASYKTATLNQFNNNINGSCNMTDSASTATNSAEDLTLLDKSLRNSMLQDVVHFKKQLVRLRRILQEDEENLMMTDTLNPFENNNGQFFTTAANANNANAAASNATSGSPSAIDNKQQENTLIKESGGVALALLEDQRLELADLRRQVVYLQGEITAKDRTIRQQQNLIEKYEAEREKLHQSPASDGSGEGAGNGSAGRAGSGSPQGTDTISTATQTERLRPLSFGGPEGLASRSEPPSPSHAPIATRNGLRSPATASSHHQHLKPKTQISSVYTQLSSIKHSTHNGLHALPSSTTGTPAPTTPLANMAAHKRSSLGSNGNLCSSNGTGSGASSPSNKTVRTTHIGNVLTSSKLQQNGASGPPSPTTPTSGGSKLLKTSVRTQMNGGASPRLGHASSPTTPTTTTPTKRMSAIKPPSSFASGTFPEAAHKSRSAPATPMTERIPAPVQIVIESADGGKKQNGGCHEQPAQQNGGLRNGDSNNNNGDAGNTDCDDDAGGEKEQQQQQVADMEKDAINNKINSLKLANGLTGCNDSSCKENSLVI